MEIMKPFSKTETKTIAIILLVLFAVIYFNMAISLRKGRDSVRKNDISAIENALDTYYQKYRIYPASTKKGEIVGCFDGGVVRDPISGYPLNAIPCLWGESHFENDNFMPQDPSNKKGLSYYYESTGQKYKFYISLEGKNEAEYTPAIAAKNLQCGIKICNYGRGN